MLFIFIVPIVLGIIENKFIKYKFNGYLSFDDNACVFDEKEIYEYEFIEKIIIVFTSIEGDYKKTPLHGIPITMKLKGVENYIKILYKGKKFKYRILCENKVDYFNLNEIKRELINMGIEVKMKVYEL